VEPASIVAGTLRAVAVAQPGARTLLIKLEKLGHVQLPARRQRPVNRMRQTQTVVWSWDQSPCVGPLSDFQPLEVTELSRDRSARQELRTALGQFHYLGFGGAVGENLQYTVRDKGSRLLACLVFGAAAWKCQGRDRFIGWTVAQREQHLCQIANNSRFLILPWVDVPGLGSWILSQLTRRVTADWEAKYGHGLALLETFVERDRFLGTTYQAANWQRVGLTTGRTRQDRYTRIQAPVKEIYLRALQPNFREVLQA
jgi:Druantia protein DruA